MLKNGCNTFFRTTSINSFLRGVHFQPEILVLDEATSSIDSYSEEIIQEATEKITKGKTSIIIAQVSNYKKRESNYYDGKWKTS